ncbi:CCNL1 protein, partial [Pomatorhinus ruficollis]|nr:CCNL1 protein [Pomatorhinus ruficollis]
PARRRRRRKMAAAAGGGGPAGPQAAGAAPAPVPGPGAVLIGDRLYSGVLITLENCLLPEHTLRFTPSMSSGLDPDTETELRVTGCELIQAAGILLRLPQVAMATGQVLFQRFFYTKSFVKHSMEFVNWGEFCHCSSSLQPCFPSKPKENPSELNKPWHSVRSVLCKHCQLPSLLIAVSSFFSSRLQLKKGFQVALQMLVNNSITHIFQIIVMYLQVLECERNQHLVQTSWNYMNDSLRTDVFVRFQPESIACACIYLAARTLEIPLPNRPHWFLLFGATEEEIQEICLKILQLYTRKKVDLSDLESKIEKKKLAIEEAKAQAKGLVPEGVPSLDNTSGFSPIPKNESPKEVKGNKPSPLPVQAMKNAKRKTEGAKRTSSNSPVNGVQKGRESRSRSGSRDQSYSRSPSRSASPKHRKSESYSTSSGSKSHSRSRSRSDSPPRQFNHGSGYKGSKARGYKKSKDYKYSGHKGRKSRSRSSSRSRSRSRERSDHSGKYKKKSHYYRNPRHERSRSYERAGHRYERDRDRDRDREHPGHSRHRR